MLIIAISIRVEPQQHGPIDEGGGRISVVVCLCALLSSGSIRSPPTLLYLYLTCHLHALTPHHMRVDTLDIVANIYSTRLISSLLC